MLDIEFIVFKASFGRIDRYLSKKQAPMVVPILSSGFVAILNVVSTGPSFS